MLRKIISGGQTGVDRAALDSARECLAYSWGGWTPKGRLAEDGQLGDEYFVTDRMGCGMRECNDSRYAKRTRLNIRDSDATLILKAGRVTPGTKLTISTARKTDKPYRIVDPYKNYFIPRVVQWICEGGYEVLNVAGPRESSRSGIYERSRQYLLDVWHLCFMYERWGLKIWDPKRTANNQ